MIFISRRLPAYWLLVLAFAWSGAGISPLAAQTNTNRPVFVGSTNLGARVGQDFRYQILIGGTGRQWVGADTFTNSSISNVWTVLTNTNGRLTNANGQLNLVASNANASNPALGSLQWVRALPRTNSWLAYMQVVVSNDLPITSAQYAAAGLSLFQSNRPAGSLVFTNFSEAMLLRETSLPNRKASAFLQNNSPFTATFASNTANFYQRQAGPTNAPSAAASLVFSNLGTTNAPTNTLSYRSTTNSSLTNSNGLILGTPGPATAVASPVILLPSSTNWTVTVRVHYSTINTNIALSYVGPAIVKNSPNGTPMQMFTNRVTLALANDQYGLYVASEAFAGGTNIFEDDGAPWAWVEDEALLRFSYDASSSLLTCAFFDPAVEDWIDTEAPFDFSETPDSLGDQWGFNAGTDFFRLLLTADTSSAGGNNNGADPIYFSDLVVTTEPSDRSADSDGSSVWVSLLYDATTTNLVQQFSTPDGSFTDLTTENDTLVSLRTWGTNPATPLLLRVGAEAGQTNLPTGAVAIRSFAAIPAPGTMDYSSTNLPDGLTLDTNYGVVSGIPTTAGTNIFTVVASNPYGGLTATQSFRLSVAPTLPVLAVASNGILRFGVTNPNAIVVTATNYPAFGTNPLTFTAAGLPAGLVFSNQVGGTSAVVRGAPLAGVGTNRVVFTASNSLAGAVSITSVVTIEPGVPALRLIQNRAVPRYSTSAVVSTAQPFWTLTNSANGQNGSIFTNLFTANSNFPSNALRLNPSNGQILAQTNRITNAGNFTGVVFTLSNAGGTAVLTSTITILPSTNIILTMATNPPFPSNGIAFGAISNNFFQLLVDTNAPGQGPGFTNTFALQSGPSGIRINPTNGIVFGTNNQAGNFTLKISARNLGGFSVTNIVLTSKPSAPLFAVTTNRAQFGSNSTNALVMRLLNAPTINTNRFPVTWSADNLPPGFTSTNVGTNFVIRSTNPTEAGLFSNIVVIATNAGGATTNSNISLEVLPAVPALAVASNGTFQYEVENTNGIVVTVTNTNAGAQNTSLFPIAFSASNLPGGWTLSTNGGGLVGVIGSTGPTVATNVTNLLVTVTNKGGSRSTNLTLRVLPAAPGFIGTTTNTNLKFGISATNAINVRIDSAGQNTSNFPISYGASNLPLGLSFAASTTNPFIGVIGGSNPTQAGIFTNVVLIITNAAGTNTETISLTVLPATPQFSVATNRAQFGSSSTNPVVVTVSNTNGQNLAAFPLAFSSSNLPGGLAFTNTNSFVATAGADSPSVATNNASFTVVVTNAGGSATSNVTGFRILPALPALAAATNGSFQFQTASVSNAVTVSVTNTNGQNTNTGQFPIGFAASNLPGGLGISTNGFTFNLTGTPTVVGIFTNITVRATNLAGTNTTNLTLNLLPAVPEISRVGPNITRYLVSNASVATFNIVNTNGQNFSNFPVSYTLATNLPAGLVLTTNTTLPRYPAVISGTPTTAGTFNITITASNIGGAISQSFPLTILPSAPSLAMLSSNSFRYGTSLSNGIVVAATNTDALFTNSFPLTFSLANSPAGIGLTSTNYTTNGVEGVIGGTNPTQPGTFSNVVLTVSNDGGSTNTNLTISVLSAVPLFTVTTNRTQFGSNSPNALVITVTNSNAMTANSGLSFQVSNLPAGLALTNTNGFIARAGGTNPLVATNVTVTVTVSNEGGATSLDHPLQVLPAAPLFSVTSNRTQYGVDSSNALVVTVTNTNGGAQNLDDFPDFGFSVSPSLSGLDLTNTNGLEATYGGTNPAVVTNATLTVTVTNAGGTNTTNVSLAVLPAVPELEVATNGTIQFGVSNTSAITVTVTNGDGQNTSAFPLTFSASNLPTNFGWSLTPVGGTNGVIGSANPTRATNVTNLLITVTNAGGSASTNLNLRVLPLAPTNFVYTYGPSATNRFRAGESSVTLNVTIAATGQNTNDFPITFGDDGASLPAGLSLETNGLLSGTPSLAATYQSVFFATNEAGSGTNTNTIQVFGGAPQIVGADSVALTNLTTNTYFRYQVSARGVGQNWAGRSDFPSDMELTSNWNTNQQVTTNAALGATSNILRYTWSDTNLTYASLEWSEPLPVDSPWLASVTVLLTSNGVATSLDGLGLTGDDFVGGMLAAFGDGADPDNYVGTIFYGNSNHLSGVASANIVTNSNQVSTGILTNTSSVSMGWIGLRSTNVTGTNRLLVLGNPGTNNPTWSTNVSWPVNSWTNAAGSNSLILRLSGDSMAPVNADYAVEFEEFVIVPLGDLTYSSTNLPEGLTIDPVTGLITGTLPASPLNTTSTVTISNSLGTTNLTIEFQTQ